MSGIEPTERPQDAMDTGSEAGSPGERAPFSPDDQLSAAVQDDAPLPDDATRSRQDAELDVAFQEPTL